jgi:hypothetical protein
MGEFSRKPLLVTKPTDIRHKAKIGWVVTIRHGDTLSSKWNGPHWVLPMTFLHVFGLWFGKVCRWKLNKQPSACSSYEAKLGYRVFHPALISGFPKVHLDLDHNLSPSNFPFRLEWSFSCLPFSPGRQHSTIQALFSHLCLGSLHILFFYLLPGDKEVW